MGCSRNDDRLLRLDARIDANRCRWLFYVPNIWFHEKAVAQLHGVTKNVRALHKIAKDTAAIAERRNRIIHDPWLFDTEGAPRRFEVTAKKKLRSLAVPVPTDKVWDLAEEIREQCVRIDQLHKEVMAELGRESS